MSMLSLGPNNSKYDKEKNDIWSIGICLLVTLINEDYNIFYNWTTQEINYDLIYDKLRFVQSIGYSHDFLRTVRLILEKDEQKRVGLHDLLGIVGRRQKQAMTHIINEDIENNV